MSLHLRLGFVLLLLATIVTLALLVLSPRAPDPGGGTLSGETPPTRSRAVVRAVLDGATIELGSGERVHYLGILVPPPNDPSVPAFLAAAATEANRALVGGQSVYLESGGSATPEASDNPGSLDGTGQGADGSERYVFREDGTLVQVELVSAGYARLDPKDSGRYQEQLQAVEQEARAARLGLWQYERAAPTPTSLTLSTASLPTLAAGRDEVTVVPFVCGPGAIAGGNALDVAGAETRRAARSATIVFQVVSTTENGGEVSLNSGVPAEEHFRVLIPAELHGSFPEPPESFFAGRCIAATGRLQPYRRTTQLVVSEPADIYIVR